MTKNFARNAEGGVLPMFALTLVPLMLLIGAGTDYGRAVATRSKLQTSLDAAVLAGAKLSSGQTTEAQAVFRSDFSETGTTSSFTVGSDGSVSGTASVPVSTTFLNIAGITSITVGANSTAKARGGSNVCVLLLDPTASQALLVNSGAKLNAPNCEVHVRSTASTPAIFNAGASFVTKRTCLAGSTPIYNSITVANVETRCTAATDPFAGNLPTPSTATCNYSNGNYNGGSVSMSPGVYCGWFNFNGAATVTFAPGVYVIKNGGWNVNGGSWTGTDVTFYFADTSQIQFNSAISANLTAPTSGTYAGILFYEAGGLSKSNFVFNDSVANNLNGLIYLPSRNVTFNAKSNLNTDKATLVFNTLILNQTSWNLSPASTKTISAGSSSTSVYLSK